MRSGQLNRRITILRYTLERDARNAPTETWPEFATVSAGWRRATTNERLASGQASAQVTDVFELRWRRDIATQIDPKSKLLYDGTLYDILEVTELGQREGLLIRASAVVGDTE